jgi:hypothetical protein
VAGALIEADLVEAVATAEDVTVFAPTNQAFEAIASVLDEATPELLAAVLQYHVVAGTIGYSSTLENDTQLETLAGPSVNVTILDGDVFINSARVTATDVLVANGVIHVIDAVLNANSTNAPNPDEEQSPSNFEGATEGDIDEITNAVTETVISTVVVPTATGGSAPDASTEATTTADGAASMPTGAVGAVALFGGMALLAQL